MATDLVIRNNGTRTVQLRPYTEVSHGSHQPLLCQYEAISAQAEYSNLSLEELRLADYQYSKKDHLRASVGSSSTTSFSSLRTLPRSDSKKHPSYLNLLRGTGIEICVGTTTSLPQVDEEGTCNIWSLPKSLISYHSSFFEAACSRDFKERHENRINLPDEDPTVFALFVEWMYYGDYSTVPFSLPPAGTTNIHAKCWVLGDKLLCTDFKNHAMRLLYTDYTATIFSKAVKTIDLQYSCCNSGEHSKLRQLYVALVATHFSDSTRIHGTAEEWDSLVLQYADLRSLILQSFRQGTKCGNFLKSQEYYLDDNTKVARFQGSSYGVPGF